MKIMCRVATAALVGLALAPCGLRAQAGAIVDHDRIGDSAGDPSADWAWISRRTEVRETLAAAPGELLQPDDVIGLRYPWVLRVALRLPNGEVGQVALSADSETDDRVVVLGPPAGDGPASFEVEAVPSGGNRIRLQTGALFLTNWPADAQTCMVAAGACALNLGTAYTLRVDESGRAYLAVTEDAVEIAWWAGPDERAPAGECGSVSATTPCRQLAPARTVWTWTETEPPRRWDEDNRQLIGMLDLGGMYAALERAVEQNGHDIWDNSLLKKPLFWVTTGAVLGAVACIIWCGGDDVTGTVIINP